MTKTYSNKSNALRAANKFDAATVKQDEAGAWMVVVAGAAEGIDETPADDLPVMQIATSDAPTADEPVVVEVCQTGVLDIAIPAAPVVDAPALMTVEPAFLVCIQVNTNEATDIANFIATRFGRPAEIYCIDTDSLVQTVLPRQATKAGTPRVGGASRLAGRDPTVKPVITAASNVRMQALMDKIDAARGDAKALAAMNKFSRSGTYYKMAGRFLDALLVQAA